MFLGYLLYGIALLLVIFIIVNLIRTGKFTIADAFALLGIVVSVILAQDLPLPIGPSACTPKPQSQATLAHAQTALDPLVPGARVIWYDNFDCSNNDLSYGWGKQIEGPNTLIAISDGTIKITAQKSDNVWDGIFRSNLNIHDGSGALMLFKYGTGGSTSLFIETGKWETPSYRGWGIGINTHDKEPYQSFCEGWNGSAYFGQIISAPPTSGKWYCLLIKVGNNGELLAQLWEKDNSKNRIELSQPMGTIQVS